MPITLLCRINRYSQFFYHCFFKIQIGEIKIKILL
jgi:hypothetical protein